MNTNKQIPIFIIIAIGWSYVFWIAAAIISINNPTWNGIGILHIIGGVSPVIATIYYLTKIGNWKEFFSRLIDFSGYTPMVWFIIIAPAIIALIATYIANGKVYFSQEFLSAGIIYIVVLLFFGPIPEELGWRGVLFDGLCKGSLLKAQIVTLLVWLIWHLPLFFIQGSYQNRLGILTSGFYFWAISLILQSIIMGYLYLLSGRNISSAILFHYMVNLSGEVITKNTNSEIITLIIYAIFAFILITITPIMRKKCLVTDDIHKQEE